MSGLKSPKYDEARSSVPPNLRPDFDELAGEYRLHAVRRYGSPFVSYAILADLILAGWRRSAEPVSPSSEESSCGK